MTMREDDRDRVARQGTQAWARLKKSKSWTDWLQVGEALQVGRDWAMNQAGTNKPEGKAYNVAFGEWLTKYKLDDMDKGDRSRLFAVMDNLPAIEEWRQALTLTERMKLNHPQAVLRRWKAHIEPEKRKSDKPTPTERAIAAEEARFAAEKEVASLKALVEELTAARDARPSTEVAAAPKGNPLQGRDAGEIVDLILELPASTRQAVMHDLAKETSRKPKKSKAASAVTNVAEAAHPDEL